MSAHVESWVRQIIGLGPDAIMQIREEPHCPDPTCPLRKTTIEWTDAAGKLHRATITKPLDYVRRPDVERALRLFPKKD